MSPERWREVERLFHEAGELPLPERATFLEHNCGSSEVRRDVEELLANASATGIFLEGQGNGAATLTIDRSKYLLGREVGPFRIISRLGAGGMGEVYRGHDSRLGRDVAIKTLPAEFARDSERLARLRREARALASLNHPNIAAIYGLEETTEADCLVMELVEGDPLRGPLPIPEALRVAGQITEALEAAHAKGIVHRDLKPANILVTPEGRVKVLDFGLAKALGSEPSPDLSRTSRALEGQTIDGRVMGTPGYMSPEQARGERIDQRADIWAFGCVLFELLSGKRTFQGTTIQDTLAAVLQKEPEWQNLPSKTPVKIKELLRRCLRKEADQRLTDIGEARRIVTAAQSGWNRWKIAAAALILAAGAAAGTALINSRAPAADRSQWVQLTKFPDSVTQPALSPDGKMVAFIRGPSTFIGPGEIYVKILPDGDAVELTHDHTAKIHPAFSPDGTRIAYGTYLDGGFSWDTWEVSVLGGEPHKMLKNATGLQWAAPGQLLFSEVKMGLHMGVVTSDENRSKQRDIYLPMSEPRMAHRSYLSPDGKWVLLVEMDDDHLWEPCRIVPFDGSSDGHKVGPPEGGCTFGAWSTDGKWMYFTSNAVGGNHIWRQRFPDGKPEQVTFGPTEEEGIAMSPDGRSFITAAALVNSSMWLHDARGERQILIEGNPTEPKFTPDGSKLLYRLVKEPPTEFAYFRDAGEVQAVDLSTGRSEPVARGLRAFGYSLSFDGRQVLLQIAGADGKPQLWLAELDHSRPPRQVPNADGGFPMFLPDGEILFRRTEGSSAAYSVGAVYRIHPDGTGLRKAVDRPVLIPLTVSPDGKWFEAWAADPKSGVPGVRLFPLDGGESRYVAVATGFNWSADGRNASISSAFGSLVPEGRSYIVGLPPGQMFPPMPAEGFRSEAQIARIPGVLLIDVTGTDANVSGGIFPGPSPDTYVYYRNRVQRNLYRIPIH